MALRSQRMLGTSGSKCISRPFKVSSQRHFYASCIRSDRPPNERYARGAKLPPNPNNVQDREVQQIPSSQPSVDRASNVSMKRMPFGRRESAEKRLNFDEEWETQDAQSPRWELDQQAAGVEQSSTRNVRKYVLEAAKKQATPAKQRSTPAEKDVFKSIPNQIGVTLDGQAERFSPILLRDLCTCPSCLDPSTKQKLFATADIPLDIKVRRDGVVQNAESLGLSWENDIPGYGQDHVTSLSNDTLRALRDAGGAPSALSHYSPGKQAIWDAHQYRQLDDIDYEAYMQDDTTLFHALQQLHTHGLLFLHNVPSDEKSVSTIAERIGPVKNTFYGYTWDVRSVPEAKNVAYTSQDLGFHMDLLYMAQPPHLQFLHCIRSSAKGGASLFADSYKAAASLFTEDISAFLALTTYPTSFHYNHPSSDLYHQSAPTIRMHRTTFVSPFAHFTQFANAYFDRGNADRSVAQVVHAFQSRERRIEDFIENVSWSPPFQAPWQNTSSNSLAKLGAEERLGAFNERFARWQRAARKFNQLIHREEGMYERLMRPGECVIFDNRRVLHARRAFEVGDHGTERWLRGAYLDWDPYWSKMRVLGKKFEGGELVNGSAGVREDGIGGSSEGAESEMETRARRVRELGARVAKKQHESETST